MFSFSLFFLIINKNFGLFNFYSAKILSEYNFYGVLNGHYEGLIKTLQISIFAKKIVV